VVLASGANTYSGGTTVLAGATLSVNTDAELGATGLDIGRIALRGGELLTTTDGFNTARTVDVGEGENANILAATAGTTATYTGVLSDVGRLTVGDRTNTGTSFSRGITPTAAEQRWWVGCSAWPMTRTWELRTAA
jgi:autotransporter-associated beta strand protein